MPPLLHAVSLELRAAVLAELAASGLEEPGRAEVVHAEVVFDECQCGLLWARWVTSFLTDAFPAQVEGAVHCSALTMAAVYEVGLIRCVPGVTTISQNRVRVPSADELEASALELAEDAAALMRAVLCVARTWGKSRRYMIGAMDPATTEGQCGGSVVTLTVELSA